MTKRVTRRQRAETTQAKYIRLNRRIVRQLPVTAAETAFVWREKTKSVYYQPEPENNDDSTVIRVTTRDNAEGKLSIKNPVKTIHSSSYRVRKP